VFSLLQTLLTEDPALAYASHPAGSALCLKTGNAISLVPETVHVLICVCWVNQSVPSKQQFISCKSLHVSHFAEM
jgi:hypothetical protein